MVTYKQAGVDIAKADKFVKEIKKIAPAVGGFSGLFKLDAKRYKNPLLVSSTDGVGTKLKIAQLCNKHNTIGIDLVAMCVNDIITCGAKPMFFLDYLATGKLKVNVALQIIKGISKGCHQGNCKLLGGETAEMPGFYSRGEYDLAGFCVGIVEKKKVIDGGRIKPGDLIVGLRSSGLHSNGFSLVRKIFSKKELKGLGKELLKPTKIYVKEILSLINKIDIHGIAHVTGGGFYDNISRILPKDCQALIHRGSWKLPGIFKLIQKRGRITDKGMYRTFNMGIGMVVITKSAPSKGAKVIGKIVKGKRGVKIV
ncbi:phosphoribosylformylglycinamidine cyclo-ligase [bacterium]|nr:phosphoribosylformylglycinamidine cyclo-ligase [bacterium]